MLLYSVCNCAVVGNRGGGPGTRNRRHAPASQRIIDSNQELTRTVICAAVVDDELVGAVLGVTVSLMLSITLFQSCYRPLLLPEDGSGSLVILL